MLKNVLCCFAFDYTVKKNKSGTYWGFMEPFSNGRASI